MRCAVVGYGSIGARHARILQELGCQLAVVSRRDLGPMVARYASIAEMVLKYRPNYVVIANETSLHHDAVSQLAAADYAGKVLVEKPVFEAVRAVPANAFSDLRVAYNLRFHPAIERLRTLLDGEEVISVHGYVGQYLPDWRPGADYRQSYSAKNEMGGGVLLDLSHDLDYLLWMFGDWVRATALGGRFSALEVSSDDVFTLLLSLSNCPVVALQLNYLDRRGRRSLVVNTLEHTYEVDLIQSTVVVDKAEETISVNRDDTYRSMHLALLSGDSSRCCSIDEALSTLRLIKAAKGSTEDQKWMIQ